MYVLEFPNTNLEFFTFVTLNPSGRARLIFKGNAKMKAWERFGSKKESKSIKLVNNLFIRNKFI